MVILNQKNSWLTIWKIYVDEINARQSSTKYMLVQYRLDNEIWYISLIPRMDAECIHADRVMPCLINFAGDISKRTSLWNGKRFISKPAIYDDDCTRWFWNLIQWTLAVLVSVSTSFVIRNKRVVFQLNKNTAFLMTHGMFTLTNSLWSLRLWTCVSKESRRNYIPLILWDIINWHCS